MSVLSSTCLYTHAHAQEREREKKVKHQCFLQSEKKNLEKIKKRAFLQVRLQVRKDEGKKEGKLIPSSSSVLNTRRKERKNASNDELFPLSRVRAFLFLMCELFFRARSRERGEKNIIARKISHPMRWEREQKRTQSLNTSCSISTKTIPTASKPNAHKQTSTCTLGVFEIESPRKAENAIRRRSKENIFVGLLVVVFCR